MANTPSTVNRTNLFLPSVPTANGEVRKVERRRYSPITLGFWSGGVTLATIGCILGASMSYEHPAARVLSVLWWGIYFGCLGAAVGALPGLFMDRTPARTSRDLDILPVVAKKDANTESP